MNESKSSAQAMRKENADAERAEDLSRSFPASYPSTVATTITKSAMELTAIANQRSLLGLRSSTRQQN